MKRSPQLKRKTPLRQIGRRAIDTEEFVRFARALIATSPKPRWRKPLKKVGARAKRDEAALKAFRAGVLERAAGRCERCGRTAWDGARLVPEAHHIVNRARCPDWPKRHDAKVNGLGVCPPCHDELTRAPHDFGGMAEAVVSRAFHAFASWRRGEK